MTRVKPAESGTKLDKYDLARTSTPTIAERRWYHNICSMKLLFILITGLLLTTLFISTFFIYYFVQKNTVDQLCLEIVQKTVGEVHTFTQDFLSTTSALTAQAAQPYFDKDIDIYSFDAVRRFNWHQVKALAKLNVNFFRILYYDDRYINNNTGLPNIAQIGYWFLPGVEAGVGFAWGPDHPYSSETEPWLPYWFDTDLETGEIFNDTLVDSGDYLLDELPIAYETQNYDEIANIVILAKEDGSSDIVAFDVAQKIVKDGRLVGMAGLLRTSYDIQAHFKQISVSENGQMLLYMPASKWIIATSNDVELYNTTTNKPFPPNETPDKRINLCVNYLMQARERNISITGHPHFLSDGQEWLYIYVDFINHAGLEFASFVIIPWNDLVGQINTSYIVGVVVSVFILATSLLIALVMTVVATRPLTRLSNQMVKVAQMKLNVNMSSLSVFSEMNAIQNSFFQMVQNLTEFRSFLPDYILERFEDPSKYEGRFSALEEREEGTDKRDLASAGGESFKSSKSSKSIPDQLGELPKDHDNKSAIHSSKLSFRKRKQMQAQAAATFDTMQLGLQHKYITILYIHLNNLEDVVQHLDSTEVLELNNQVVSIIEKAVKDNKGTLMRLDVSSFIASWNSVRQLKQHAQFACKTADAISMKANRTIREMGNGETLYITMGIATGLGLVGNIGTPESRRFEIIGKVVLTAEKLSCLAYLAIHRILNSAAPFSRDHTTSTAPNHNDENRSIQVKVLRALVNNDCYKEVSAQYVFCPYDIMLLVEKEDPCAVYELYEENNKSHDEWLYELQNSSKASRFDKFHEAFNLMKERRYEQAIMHFQELLTDLDSHEHLQDAKTNDLDLTRVSKLLDACSIRAQSQAVYYSAMATTVSMV